MPSLLYPVDRYTAIADACSGVLCVQSYRLSWRDFEAHQKNQEKHSENLESQLKTTTEKYELLQVITAELTSTATTLQYYTTV